MWHGIYSLVNHVRGVKKGTASTMRHVKCVPKHIHKVPSSFVMMTSSNGNIFRVTGPLCGNSMVTGEFPTQRPVTWSFDVFFDLRLNKQSRGWWFETPSRSLWRHCNVLFWFYHQLLMILVYPCSYNKTTFYTWIFLQIRNSFPKVPVKLQI